MKVSVLISAYNRAKALERSLFMLSLQDYPDEYEVIVIDDGSDEDIKGVCSKFKIAKYRRIRPAHSPIREANMGWRAGFEMATGDFISLSHPEILAPKHALSCLVNQWKPGISIAPKLYFIIDKKMQDLLDTVRWKIDLDLIRRLPGFWVHKTHWGNKNADMIGWRNHTAFYSLPKEVWKKFGFMPEVERTGSDIEHLYEKHIKFGYKFRMASFTVYHQDHMTIQGETVSQSVRVARIEMAQALSQGKGAIAAARDKLNRLEARDKKVRQDLGIEEPDE